MVRKANIIQKQELGGGKGCAEVHEINNSFTSRSRTA